MLITIFKKLFCQVYCFNFQSNLEAFLTPQNFVRLLVLASHIEFENCKALQKKFSE